MVVDDDFIEILVTAALLRHHGSRHPGGVAINLGAFAYLQMAKDFYFNDAFLKFKDRLSVIMKWYS